MNNIRLFLKNIFKIIITVFLFCFLLYTVNTYYHKGQITRINYFMPLSYGYFSKLARGQADNIETKLPPYKFYYQLLIKRWPQMAEPYGLLGFCEYYLGNIPEAIDAYEKAKTLNPYFFWFHYNLGIIYFQDGQYDKAIESFSQAQASDPKRAVMFINTSERLYFPILRSYIKNPQKEISEQLQKAYRDSNVLMVLSARALEGFSVSKIVLQQVGISRLQLGIF